MLSLPPSLPPSLSLTLSPSLSPSLPPSPPLSLCSLCLFLFVYLFVFLSLYLDLSFAQVFYFMQPDTTPLKIAQDVNTKLSERQPGAAATKMSPNSNKNAQPAPPEISRSEYENPPTPPVTDQSCQVVPLYTPAGSVVKLFCVHPSHRFALSLAAMASGFQFQVRKSAKGERHWGQGNVFWSSRVK